MPSVLTSDEVDDILAHPPKDVGPKRVNGARALQRYVSSTDAIVLRETMSSLLANNASTDAIVDHFSKTSLPGPNGTKVKGFGLTPAQTISLMAEVRVIWQEEDAENRQWNRAAAERRILVEIREARKAGKHTAVAMHETNLARIQGTLEPIEVHVNDDTRVNDALMTVLGAVDPAAFRKLVAKGRERYIEAQGTTVSTKTLVE